MAARASAGQTFDADPVKYQNPLEDKDLARAAGNAESGASEVFSRMQSTLFGDVGDETVCAAPFPIQARGVRCEAPIVALGAPHPTYAAHRMHRFGDKSDSELRTVCGGLFHPHTALRQAYDSVQMCILLYFLFILPYR